MLSCIRFVRFLSLFSCCHRWIKIITCVCFLLLIYGYATFVVDGLTFLRNIVSMLSVSRYLTFLFVIPSCQEKSGVRLSRFVNSEYLHLHPLSIVLEIMSCCFEFFMHQISGICQCCELSLKRW